MKVNIKNNPNNTIIFQFENKNITFHKNDLFYIVEEITETVSFYNKNDNTIFLTILLSDLSVENDQVNRNNVETLLSNSLFFLTGVFDDFYIKEEIDEKLSKKQNNLIAGENIELTELESGNYTIKATIPKKPLYSIVDVLPSEGESDTIYLIRSTVPTEFNKFYEFIYVDGEWEDMGLFQDDVDLTNYYTKTEVDEKDEDINDRIDTTQAYSVNTYPISDSPVLNGSDIKLDNYIKPEGVIEPIDSNDTALTGIEKLDKFLEREISTRETNEGIINETLSGLTSDIDTINTDINTVNAYTVNGKTISSNPVLNAKDILIVYPENSITGGTVNQTIYELEKEIQENKGEVDGYTINDYFVKNSPVLGGSDIKLPDYIKGTSISPITSADTVNTGIGKLEYKTDKYKTDIDAYTVNEKTISNNPVLGGEDIVLTNYVPTITGTSIVPSDTVNTAISKLFNEIKSSGGDFLPLSGGTLTGTVYGTTISASTLSGGTISGTTIRGGTYSGSTITASTSMRTPIISATTSAYTPSLSATTITASTSVYSPVISATTITGGTSIYSPVVSATTITAATSFRTAILSATTSAYTPTLSATTVSGTNIYATNFVGNNGFFSTSSMTPSMMINNSTTGETVKNYIRFGINNSSIYDFFVKNYVSGSPYNDYTNTLILSKAGSTDLHSRVVFDLQNASSSGSVVPIISLHRYSTSQPNMIEFDNFTTQAGAKWYVGMMSNAHFDFIYGSRTDAYANGILFTIEASSGNIKAKGNCSAVTFVTTSDVRLKTNIEPLSNRGRLKPVKFNFKENGNESIGFLAQDVQEIYPEVVPVSTDENGFLGINYGSLTAVLAVQINELFDEVDKLKMENKKLNKENKELIEDFNDKFKELNTKNKEFKDTVSELNTENVKLNNTINKLNLDNKELLKNVVKLHTENTKDFNNKFNELYSKFNDKTDDLIFQNNELRKEIDILKSDKEIEKNLKLKIKKDKEKEREKLKRKRTRRRV
ncbi:hypothetical protein EZS27_008666 [termite gut metagenome]|uniref:Peptidase S74 domain-containing protein n=1 Tax=termite gut metagenome TaxID=433724 RepID=A0A5J4SEH7_9ZZZZ